MKAAVLERSTCHIAFQLEQVDIVGGKASHAFIQRCRNIASGKHHRGDIAFVRLVGRHGLSLGQDQETSGVAFDILHVGLQDLQIV